VLSGQAADMTVRVVDIAAGIVDMVERAAGTVFFLLSSISLYCLSLPRGYEDRNDTGNRS